MKKNQKYEKNMHCSVDNFLTNSVEVVTPAIILVTLAFFLFAKLTYQSCVVSCNHRPSQPIHSVEDKKVQDKKITPIPIKFSRCDIYIR